MHCPKCSQSELVSSAKASDALSLCDFCGGLWISTTAAMRLLKTQESVQPVLLDSSEHYRINDAKTGLCPLGHGILIRVTVHDKQAYSLERCVQCGGMWFDNGEWGRFKDNPNEHHVMDWDADELLALADFKATLERSAIIREFGEPITELIERVADELRGRPETDKALNYLRLLVREP